MIQLDYLLDGVSATLRVMGGYCVKAGWLLRAETCLIVVVLAGCVVGHWPAPDVALAAGMDPIGEGLL